MCSKAELRRRIRELLRFSPGERAEKSARICEQIAREPAWLQARTVAIFAPTAEEPDVELLWADAAGKRICYPRVRGAELVFLAVADHGALTLSRWNLREPPDGSASVGLGEIDLILVPGIAFTADGQRLGRGGGYYDRLLASPQLRALKIGVCFSAQIVEQLPRDAHDMAVDRVIHEGA